MLFEAITALFNSRVVNPYADLVAADILRQNLAGEVQRQAIRIENLVGADTDYEAVAESLVALVTSTKDALVTLPADQQTAVKAAMKQIIKADTPQKEEALESLFDLLIESVQAEIEYSELLNLYLKPVETV
jgi:hypothetical protein